MRANVILFWILTGFFLLATVVYTVWSLIFNSQQLATQSISGPGTPIEWVGTTYPPVLVTTSRRDPFYRANLNFIAALRRHRVPVDSLVDEQAPHTWQQDTRHPASLAVYERLQAFVRRVAPIGVV